VVTAKYLRWISGALAAIAIGELIVLVLLAAGLEGRTGFGPFLIRLHTLHRPLWIGLGASLALVALAPQSRYQRRLGFLLMGSLTALAVVVLARTSPAIVAKSDIAVMELYVQLAATGDLLVGAYSRFHWHHPGPLYFWLQVPFYALSGETATGLYAGALAMNVASLGLLGAVLLRVDRGALAVSVLSGCLLFVWRERFVMASPWTAHVPGLATAAFVVVAAAAASGRRWMLPLVVLVGSAIAQTHVALVPLVLLLSAAAAIAAALATRHDRMPFRGVLNACAWLLALLWMLPVAEQLSHTPGNLTRLWAFFVTGTGPGQPYSRAVAVWSYALTGAFRPDLYTPYGGHFELTHLAWGIPVAIAEVIALAVVGTRARRSGRKFEASLAWTALAATLVSLWSITRIRGDVLDHEIFWIVPLGAINAAIAAGAAWRAAARRWSRQDAEGASAWSSHAATVFCAMLFLVGVHAGIRDFDRLVRFENSKPRKDADINGTYESLRIYLFSQEVRKPLFRIDGDWDVAVAALARLHHSRRPFAVDDTALWMFTDAFSAHGDEDAFIVIGSSGRNPRRDASGEAVIVQREPVVVEAVRLRR
jgi:hypothetical protein